MAAISRAEPISVPTALGAREIFDIAATVLNMQKIESPQASLHACASRYGAQTIRSIFEKLEQKDMPAGFEEINLTDNNIGDEGARWLLEGLSRTTSSGVKVGTNLKKLIAPRGRIGTVGMKAIGGIIGASESLENVILSSNICGAEGVSGEFCEGLAKNRTVRSICLAACRIGDAGATALCEGPLRVHPKLEHISLEYNRLGAPAAKSIASMLAVNRTLRYLDLCGNSIGALGAKELVEGIKQNRGSLQRLGVAQNEIQADGVRVFCDMFMSPDGQALEYLDVRFNGVSHADIRQVQQNLGKPADGQEGWMLRFGERQLLIHR